MGGGQPGIPPSDFWKISKFKNKETFQILIQEIAVGLKWRTLKFSYSLFGNNLWDSHV
jgi:hypothetical protein